MTVHRLVVIWETFFFLEESLDLGRLFLAGDHGVVQESGKGRGIGGGLGEARELRLDLFEGSGLGGGDVRRVGVPGGGSENGNGGLVRGGIREGPDALLGRPRGGSCQ